MISNRPRNHSIIGMVRSEGYMAYREELYPLVGLYDRPLPCFGCGIGWFSFIFGFVFPFAWYYGTFLYLRNYYYQADPRERAGLAACAIAALFCTVAVLIVIIVLLV